MASQVGTQPKRVKNAKMAAQSEAVEPKSAAPEKTSGNHGAAALQSLLHKEFIDHESAEKPVQEAPAPAPTRIGKPLTPTKSRMLKTVAGLAIIATVGWLPLQRLFQVSSVEAVVNAQVVTLRAPISGVVEGGLNDMRVGSPVTSGVTLTEVANPRADHNNVERVAENLETAREDLAAVEARISRLTDLRMTVSQRVEAYRADRKVRVAADISEIDAQLIAANAVLERADTEFQRQSALSKSGAGARTARENAKRDLDVAKAVVDQAQARKTSLGVEAEALSQNRFFGDGYDDEPRSAQRLDDIAETMSLLQPEKSKLETRVKRLENGLQREKGQFQLASSAKLIAPAQGQIWELLTAPGEQVVAGQPLVSVLDCSKLLVTTAVTEAVYNTLSVGMDAHFTFRDGSTALPGKIVQMSGVSSAASNFAILPSALTKEAYRVSVAVDGMRQDDACPVGRTGRVVFGKAAS